MQGVDEKPLGDGAHVCGNFDSFNDNSRNMIDHKGNNEGVRGDMWLLTPPSSL